MLKLRRLCWMALVGLALAGWLAGCGGGTEECQPSCDGKTCGQDDGCGGHCTACPTDQTCNAATWQCEGECTPDCAGKTCGQDDGCGDRCTGCPAGQTCNAATWQCEGGCTPDCSGRVCGPDPVCSQSCGSCQAGESCDAQGQCQAGCQPDCSGRVCGPDPVCNQSCGNCQAGESCDAQGQCQAGGNLMPQNGTWAYDEFGYSQNSCYWDFVGNGDGGFIVNSSVDPTFHVVPGDGTDPFDCTVTGTAFHCDRLSMTQDLTGEGFAAVLSSNVDVDGTIADGQHFSGAQSGSVACTGVACAALATYLNTSFPCNFSVDFQTHRL